MTEREQYILQLVVEDVVNTGEPVGSQYLVEKYNLSMSPATLRNIFVSLEKTGYLTHPHTSAGRVPTEKGYRFYLKQLMKIHELRVREQAIIRDAAQNMRLLASALASLTETAFVMINKDSLMSFSTGFFHLLAQPEFVDHASVIRVSTAMDDLEKTFLTIQSQIKNEPLALIGSDCPFGEECGSVFMRMGNGAVISLFGPLRMNYARAYAALKSAQEHFDTYEE